MASIRTRSASPKSVSFSPVLERKYSADQGPLKSVNPPEASTDWRKYFTDFSAYLGKLGTISVIVSQVAFIVRPCAISVACQWSVRKPLRKQTLRNRI